MDTCKNCTAGHAFRERAVPCQTLGCRRDAWRHDGKCDGHTAHPTR